MKQQIEESLEFIQTRMQTSSQIKKSLESAVKQATAATERVIREVGHSYPIAKTKWTSVFQLGSKDVLLEGRKTFESHIEEILCSLFDGKKEISGKLYLTYCHICFLEETTQVLNVKFF